MPLQEKIGSVILLWKTWSIHGFVLCSLSLQIFLFFAGPFRKKTTNVALVVLVWLAYQLVGTAITRAIALIYSANKQHDQRAELADVYTFWCAFLFLHFGGPDTITALAVEDNNLWRRSWIQFFTNIFTTLNAVLAVPLKRLILWPNIYISAILILLAGTLKSAERILSLRNASFRHFQWSIVREDPNPGPDYAAIVEDHDLYKKAGVPVKFDEIQDSPVPISSAGAEGGAANTKLNDSQVVIEAYRFFHKFKGMYVDMVYCCHDRKQSRDLFLRLSWQDAFRVLETEMKLAYETFYTKTPFFCLPLGKLSRWLSFILQLIAMLLWFLEHKPRFRPVDVKVTYILLTGALVIDVAAIIRFRGSDWKIGRAAELSSRPPCLSGLLMYTRRRRWGENEQQETPRCQKSLRILFRQWSESISQFNFMDYCIYERPKWKNKLFSLTGSKDMMDGWRYVSQTWFTNQLRDFLFGELRAKSSVAEDLDIGEEVSSSRGSWVLRSSATCDLDPAIFEQWIMDVEYDESLLIWHLATELCYETELEPQDDVEKGHRRFSKILSDYMFYLFLRQPKLMSELAPMAEVIFNDTGEQAKQFFQEVMASSLPNAKFKELKKQVHREACTRIMQVRTDLPPSYINGESRSVLFDACRLAKKLIELKKKKVDQWKFTSQIWVELLCYAAAQSPADVHIVQLCTGGELVTLVRLLMLHLGLTNQFRKAKSIPRAELVVGR